MTPAPGDPAELTVDGLVIYVLVVDTRRSYGRTDVLVRPVAGSGEKWVTLDRLTRRAQ